MTPAERAAQVRDIATKFPAGSVDTPEDRIVNAIESDLSDRRGLKWEWEGIDHDVKEEIREVWREIIRQEMAA